MIPSLARGFITRNQPKLFSNRLRLVNESSTMTLVSGTPIMSTTQTTHWEGYGSIQYVRPRIQKAFGDENQGTIEDPISVIVHLPYEALPTEGMVVVDIDGVTGEVGLSYRQSRRPANVAGINTSWELYLGLPSNA
jgi:hypothetical protein